MAADQSQLIGADVGATRVRAARIRVRLDGLLETEAVNVLEFPPLEFTPLPLEVQAREPAGPEELAEADKRLEVVAWAVASVARSGRPLRLGLAVAGAKTPDGRGIALARNGPRSPAFLSRLATLLKARGLSLAVPPPPLGSDGTLAGLGEERSPIGAFRDCASAYYLGAGTGLAEALKLEGRLVEPPLPKLYELRSAEGPVFEDLVAARHWPNPHLMEHLEELLRARLQGLTVERIVLGSHLRRQEWADILRQRLEQEVVISRLEHPALLGGAALALAG